MADLSKQELPFVMPEIGRKLMFKFGCSTVIELEDAITFARIFGLVTEHHLFVLHGRGRNGKSKHG